MEAGKLQGGKKKIKASDQGSDEEQVGDQAENKEDEDIMDLGEEDKIKYNLKNSSNVYYKITHSITDEVTT